MVDISYSAMPEPDNARRQMQSNGHEMNVASEKRIPVSLTSLSPVLIFKLSLSFDEYWRRLAVSDSK